MIVAPTPTSPRSPLRRALRVLGVAAPVALLVAAIGVGLGGPQPVEPVTFAVPTATPPPVAVATPGQTAAPAPAEAGPSPVADPDVPPAVFDGIQVTAGPDPLAAGRPGPDVVVALAGRLLLDDPLDPTCLDVQDDPLGPWCERRAWLSINWTVAGAEAPHLALVIPAGIRMPATTAGVAPERRPLVVVLARWLPEREACMGRDVGCVDELIVERFAWAGGVRVGLTPLLDPRLESSARRPNPFSGAAESIIPLSALLTWPESLPPVEAAAAEAAAQARDGDPVWYVRGAVPELDGRLTIRWAVLAEHDLVALGWGTASDEAVQDRVGPG